jgi:hypothetical protein
MPDTPPLAPAPGDTRGFPFATVLATLVGLFLFFGLVLVAYYSPNYLGEPKAEPKADPAAKLNGVRVKNQAVLDGTDPGVKMPLGKAVAEVLSYAEKNNRLPFPVEKTAPPKDAKDGKDPKAPPPKPKGDD